MRRLMWFVIGFGASAAVCTYGWITEGLVFPAYVFAALFVLLLAEREFWKHLRIPAVVCLGIACGLLWFQIYSSAYLARTFPLDGQIADVTARCTDYGEPTASGTAVDCVLYLDGIAYRSRLYLRGDVNAEPGDVLTGAFRFRTAAPTGEFDTNTWQGKGIFLIGYQEEDCELKKLVVEKARKVVLLMDSSKLNKSLPYTFCSLDAVDCIVTDEELPYDITERAKQAGITILLA